MAYIFKGIVVLLELGVIRGLRHPNILLIVADDLRPSIGCYGDEIAVTPNINSLALSGVVFNKAYAQQALCGPSRTSFLTSHRPDSLHLIDVHSYWRLHAGNFTTLPQYFKEHGYHTKSVGKVFHPGIVSNFSDDQPFSWSEEPFHPSSQRYKNAPVCLGEDGALHENIYCPVDVDVHPESTLPDIQTTSHATEWIRRRAGRNKSSPFFLAVGYHKPHIPLKFPKEYLGYYRIEDMPLAPNRHLPAGLPAVAWNPWNDLRRRYDISRLNLSFPYGPMPDFYARYIRQGYYASVTYIDALIGKLMSEIKIHFPNTIVALLGDHGWSLGEHQEWSKYSNYEVATRVPFIVSRPGTLEPGIFREFGYSRVESLVELVDLFPTLVDLAGLKGVEPCDTLPPYEHVCTDGKSLVPLIKNYAFKYKHKSKFSCHSTYRKLKRLLHFVKGNRYMSYFNMAVAPLGQYQNKISVVALSQYPRPAVNASVKPDSDQPRLKETKIMGYSARSQSFRYSVWVEFDHITFKSNWSAIYGEELYDHKYDSSENYNLIGKKSYDKIKIKMFSKIRSLHNT